MEEFLTQRVMFQGQMMSRYHMLRMNWGDMMDEAVNAGRRFTYLGWLNIPPNRKM